MTRWSDDPISRSKKKQLPSELAILLAFARPLYNRTRSPMAPSQAQSSSSSVGARAAAIEQSLRTIIRGNDEVVRLALVAVLARGHLLIERLPGVGKTTLAHALPRALDCTFQRIQFTSDMLPSDVLGISVYSATEQQFEFKPGPLFTSILLAH